MRLTADQIEAIETAYEAESIPPDSAVLDDLEAAFGEHTFFIDGDGLLVWEEAAGGATVVLETAQAYRVASWADDDMTELAVHAPEPLALAIRFATGRPPLLN